MVKTKVSFIGGKPAPAGDFPSEFFVPQFINSWLEYAGQKFTQVLKTASQTGAGTTNLYTVPSGHFFFLTSWNWRFIAIGGTGLRTGGFFVAGSYDLHQAGVTTETTATNGSVSLPMPIKISEGQTLSITCSADSTHSVNIQGFLVPAAA